MATKVPQKQTSESTEMQTVESFLPVSADQLVNVTSPDSRLPTLKLVYPIEIDGTRIKPEHGYAFGMFQGDAFVPLPEGIVMTVLAARDSTRQLQVEVGGKAVAFNRDDPSHQKLDKSYTRFFKQIGKFNNTHEAYVESLKDASYQRGIDYLVAVLLPDGSCAIADLPAYKTASSYWHKPLGQALLTNKLGAKILIANHAVNVVSSKSNAAQKYVSPNNFNQFKIDELTMDQLQAIQSVMQANKADVDSWFAR